MRKGTLQPLTDILGTQISAQRDTSPDGTAKASIVCCIIDPDRDAMWEAGSADRLERVAFSSSHSGCAAMLLVGISTE